MILSSRTHVKFKPHTGSPLDCDKPSRAPCVVLTGGDISFNKSHAISFWIFKVLSVSGRDTKPTATNIVSTEIEHWPPAALPTPPNPVEPPSGEKYRCQQTVAPEPPLAVLVNYMFCMGPESDDLSWVSFIWTTAAATMKCPPIAMPYFLLRISCSPMTWALSLYHWTSKTALVSKDPRV